jgi:hypothetical protein
MDNPFSIFAGHPAGLTHWIHDAAPASSTAATTAQADFMLSR